MISLIYISQAKIESGDRTRVLDDIVAVAIARNSMLDITGLLIASPQHFAQLLEGPVDSVGAVMSSITADPRHTALRIVRQSIVEKGICPHWRMARFDSENFGPDQITPVLRAAHAGEGVGALRRLERLMGQVTRSAISERASDRSRLRA